jgi:hypothetical protein
MAKNGARASTPNRPTKINQGVLMVFRLNAAICGAVMTFAFSSVAMAQNEVDAAGSNAVVIGASRAARISDRLMLDDGMNAASPFVTREVQRELKRRPHQCHRENSDKRSRASEASRGQGQTAAEGPENIISRDANAFESELRQEVRTMPH